MDLKFAAVISIPPIPPSANGKALCLGIVHQIAAPAAEQPGIREAELVTALGRLERGFHGALEQAWHVLFLAAPARSVNRLWDYCRTKSPSRLAATVSFESV